MPRFTIIVPVHNSEAFMTKCLESIKMQVFKDYELIIVLDACTDRSKEIALQYTNNIIEVNYHDNGIARNPAIRSANGQYILFIDSDDWYLHEYVLTELDRKLKEESLKRESPDILFFSFIIKGIGYHSPVGGEYYPAFWNKAWKWNFIQRLTVTPHAFGADVDFQDDAFALKPTIVEWDRLMYYYNHRRVGSITEVRNRK